MADCYIFAYTVRKPEFKNGDVKWTKEYLFDSPAGLKCRGGVKFYEDDWKVQLIPSSDSAMKLTCPVRVDCKVTVVKGINNLSIGAISKTWQKEDCEDACDNCSWDDSVSVQHSRLIQEGLTDTHQELVTFRWSVELSIPSRSSTEIRQVDLDVGNSETTDIGNLQSVVEKPSTKPQGEGKLDLDLDLNDKKPDQKENVASYAAATDETVISASGDKTTPHQNLGGIQKNMSQIIKFSYTMLGNLFQTGDTVWTTSYTCDYPVSHSVRGGVKLEADKWKVILILSSDPQKHPLIWPVHLKVNLFSIKVQAMNLKGSLRQTWQEEDLKKVYDGSIWDHSIDIALADLDKDAEGTVTFRWEVDVMLDRPEQQPDFAKTSQNICQAKTAPEAAQAKLNLSQRSLQMEKGKPEMITKDTMVQSVSRHELQLGEEKQEQKTMLQEETATLFARKLGYVSKTDVALQLALENNKNLERECRELHGRLDKLEEKHGALVSHREELLIQNATMKEEKRLREIFNDEIKGKAKSESKESENQFQSVEQEILMTQLDDLRKHRAEEEAKVRELKRKQRDLRLQEDQLKEKIRQYEVDDKHNEKINAQILDIERQLQSLNQDVQKAAESEKAVVQRREKLWDLHDDVDQVRSMYQQKIKHLMTEMTTLTSTQKLQELVKEIDKYPQYIASDVHSSVFLQRIRPFFVFCVNPVNVLYLIHAYDPDVLVEQDIQEIQHVTEQYGSIRAANELLFRLVRYKGWLSCIIDVLRDPKVQLNHVADKIQEVVEKSDEQDIFSSEARTFLFGKDGRFHQESQGTTCPLELN